MKVLPTLLLSALAVTSANAKTIEYVTGYLIEKALATENVFIWVTVGLIG